MAEVIELVTRKKCFSSSLDELNIIPMKVIVSSGGRSRFISSPSARASKGAAVTERPNVAPPSTLG